ncbi:MAG: rhomboid family intramembrane serine protease [Phycisphaerae bacterium]|nr:rhomboid family intramembrane serine protease [Phycisphaerae bacterium]NIP50843.1 rhomboid family intramembrane serine protease [Phycisphaerae bacterium]NIS52979.1 rhomboid family intramembrane serine protease [Phycisphaerae bacterium]NIU09751.1 rhomboid family intramembrane serine protease [Phycisphaerae bacterium]NIU55334.1 rhomboid family intramembrane serine protease [Phycisphaerae bacterium]
MGLYDRDYTQADFEPQFRSGPYARFAMPKITPVVKWLLIINIAVFLLTFLIKPLGTFIYYWFSVFPATLGMSLQLWRQITYQFLHDGPWHIFVNMLVLYFFGPLLERLWGSKKFLTFYLVCGAMGGLLYPFLVLVGWLGAAPLVGASGSILGMLAAGGILFPNMMVYVWGVIPVKMRILAIIFAAISIITLLRPDRFENAGGQAAHLGGMVAGAVYVLSQSRRDKFRLKLRSGSWQKKRAAQRNLQVEVDRILEKVHRDGIQSLTMKEKRILKQATKAEQTRNKF